MHPVKKYSTALRWQVEQWIKKLKQVDIVVGLPGFNNEDTIGKVILETARGLDKYFKEYKSAIFISDGGSLDDTRENAYSAEIPEFIHRRVAIYRGLPGKGTSLRAIFELATKLEAKVCIVVDSDLRSITPEWIKNLVTPILENKADFLTPLYKRHKYDGTITNHIIYPFTKCLYGADIRQPIGGDFGLSGALADFFQSQDVWDTDVAHFGIDIWMTTTALNENFRVGQVQLGSKIHDAKDPATDLGAMFQEVVSTLFYLMGKYENRWRTVSKPINIPTYGEFLSNQDPPSIIVDMDKLVLEFLDGFRHFEPLYQQILTPTHFERLTSTNEMAKIDNRLDMQPDLWARILCDFAFMYQNWTRNRRRLVSILVPLYFGRVGSYCNSVSDLSNNEAENLIREHAKLFCREKPYLIKRFREWE